MLFLLKASIFSWIVGSLFFIEAQSSSDSVDTIKYILKCNRDWAHIGFFLKVKSRASILRMTENPTKMPKFDLV